MAAVTGYFERFDAADTTVPGAQALLPIAKALDDATEQALTGLMTVLRGSEEHRARVALLTEQPRTAGKFSRDKMLFEGVSAFEQMVAVSDWLADANIRKPHTFFLAAPDEDYVPLQAKKFKTVDANMMHVVLGATRGDHKAPKYTTWAESSPWEDTSQKTFIYALEGLEIIRQPHYSAATILKGNAFELDLINSEWRYGSEFACVESRGQAKDTPKKRQSSALNACTLVNRFSDVADPQASEKNIALPIKYEDYADEGYDDDLDTSVSPGQIIQAAERAIVGEESEDLEQLMETLVIAKVGVPATPVLRNHIAQILKSND